MLGVKMPSLVVGTGGKFRYEEREVPDTFNILVDYPEKITLSMVGTQGNDYPGAAAPPAGRSPIIRGWEGTLTFEGEEIVFTPVQGTKKEGKRVKIERPFDHVRHMKNLLDCCRTRREGRVPGRPGLLHADAAADGHSLAARGQGGQVRRGGGEDRPVSRSGGGD